MLESILADRDLIVDMVKVSTMLIVSRLLIGGNLNDDTWMKGSVYTLIGFASYHVLTKKIVKNTIEDPVKKRVLNTWLKVGTMLTVSRLLSGQELNEKWLMESVYTILGFNAFDAIVLDLLPLDGIKNDSLKSIVIDTVNVVTMSSVSALLAGKKLDEPWALSTLNTCVGFAVYTLVTNKLVN
jgi:hypothetical protein